MHGRWLRLYMSHTWRIMRCNPKQILGGDGESWVPWFSPWIRRHSALPAVVEEILVKQNARGYYYYCLFIELCDQWEDPWISLGLENTIYSCPV